MTHPHSEILDIVDANDTVIGTIDRDNYDKLVSENLGYIREVAMFIQNDEGKLWIPTRTAHKKIAPNGLDYSMAGHVETGESYVETAIRETKEELNLDIVADDLEFIRKFPPKAIPYFRTLYIYRSNQTPDYNPDDFSGAEWLTVDEIAEKIQSGTPAKVSLVETIEWLQVQTTPVDDSRS